MLSDDYLRAIGRIAVEFGELEWILHQFVICGVGDRFNVSEMVSDELGSFERRLNFAGQMFDERCSDQTWRNNFKAFRGKLKQVQQKRNTILHSAWNWNASAGYAAKIPSRKTRENLPQEKFTAAQLNYLANGISPLAEEFLEYWTKLAEVSPKQS